MQRNLLIPVNGVLYTPQAHLTRKTVL